MPENEKRGSLASAFYPLAGLILIWALYLPAIFSGTSTLAGPLEHDIGFQWIPFKEFNRWAFGQGYFPLWNPYVFAGMPFLAFSHSQVLYPLGWMLTFFDYARAVNFFYPIHLSIGFLGLYFLIRNLSVSRFSAFLAAISAILSGKFFYFVHFLPIASSNFWGIWFFFFLVKLVQKRTAWSFLGLSLMLCLEILGGDIESTSYQLFFAPFFVLILLRGQKKIWNPVWVVLALSIVLGILLALAQFLPQFEYSRDFLRSVGFTFNGFETRTMPLQFYQGLIFTVAEVAVAGVELNSPFLYLGIIGVFFPIYATFSDRKNIWLFLLAVVILLFSFGSLKPLDWIAYHIPFLNRFGAQEHSFFVFQILWALLAGMGIDNVLQKWKTGILLFFIFAAVLNIIGILLFGNNMYYLNIKFFCSLAFILGVFVFSKRTGWAQKLIPICLTLIFLSDSYLHALISDNPNLPLYRFQISEDLKNLPKTAGQSGARTVAVSRSGLNDYRLLHHLGMRTHVGTIDGWITTPPLSYAKLLNLIEPRSVEFKDGRIEKFGFNVDFRDGNFVQAEHFPIMDLLSLKYFLVYDMNLKFASPFMLSRHPFEKVIINEPYADRRQGQWGTKIRISSNVLRVYRIYFEKADIFKTDLDLTYLFTPLFFSMIFKDKNGPHILYSRALDNQTPRRFSLSLGRYSGCSGELELVTSQIKYPREEIILENPRIENPDRPIQMISDTNGIEIFENREAFPEAFIVHSCRWVTDPEQVLAELKKATRWDLEKEIILSRESGSARAVKATGEKLRASGFDFHTMKAPVQKIADHPDRIVFKIRAAYPGYLFLNHQYLPGWRAFVDGKEWPIEKADSCFCAVFVDSGAHTVEFRYQPAGFEIGLYAGIASFLSFFFFAGVVFLFKNRADQNRSGLKNN